MDLDVTRRDFSKLTVAAVAGMLAGTAGCSNDKPAASKVPTPDLGKPEGSTDAKPEPAAEKGTDEKVAKAEVHLCRGLNACKGQGGGKSKGENACAGQGDCATVKEHSCGGENECKGLGGCGASAGANECKGKGGCHVPLMDEAWKTVRTAFEKKMTEQSKKFGNPPDKG